MTDGMKRAWDDYLRPFLKRPRRLQVAALCYCLKDASKKVLLITSRDTGRWIIPKGWPIDGLDAGDAALQEAWEEAGVKHGRIAGGALGSYRYDKELGSGLPIPVDTLVFPVEVKHLEEIYPEAGERNRKWVSPEEAANMVREPELKTILRQLQ